MYCIGKRLPVKLGGLQERQGAHHVGPREGERVLYRTVNVALCGKVDDAVHMLLAQKGAEPLEVAHVHPHEPVVGAVLDVAQVGQVARVGQPVKIDYPVLRVLVHEKADNMAPYEARSAGYHYASLTHGLGSFSGSLCMSSGSPSNKVS